jgi:hypothetical protein
MSTTDIIEDEINTRLRKLGLYWAICHNANCINNNIPIVSNVFFVPPVIYCGPCNNIIEDLTKIET